MKLLTRNHAGQEEAPAMGGAKKISPRTELLAFLVFLAVLLVFCAVSTRILTPKRLELGATWGMYLQEEPESVDVLFLGSSLAYCDVVPAILQEASGMSAYVMAGPSQGVPLTYYYLRECCKTQSPKTVFVECTGLVYGPPEELKANLGFMPWGMERLAATFRFAPKDQLMGLLFPLYAYHDRWVELTAQDFQPYKADPLAGYNFLGETKPIDKITERKVSEKLFTDPAYYQEGLEYLEKICEFCREKGIRPVFFLVPSTSQLSGELTGRMEQDIKERGGEFVSFYDCMEECGLDLSEDFYDRLHLNCWGAEKFSQYLGERLSEWAVPTAKPDPELWQERLEHFKSLQVQAWEKREKAEELAEGGDGP